MTTFAAALFSFLFYSCSAPRNIEKTHVSFYNKMYEQSSDVPYPNENFLYLKRSIRKESENFPLSSASGIAIKKTKDTIYGLTAAHWCADIVEPEFESYMNFAFGYDTPEKIKENTVNQVDFYGKTYNIEILSMDNQKDICLIKFKSPYASKIKKIKVASKPPKIGDKVFTAGAPMGISSSTIRHHFSGHFSGCVPGEEVSECFFSLPGIVGSSGSGILNKKGELVGLLNFTIIGFNNLTGGPSTLEIKEFILKELP